MEPWWIPPLREVVGDRDVVIAGAVPAAWNEHADQLRAAGARSLLVVATEGRGAGTGPDVPTVVVEAPEGMGTMERLRFGLRGLESPPPEVVAALDEFDPSGEAVVVGAFLNTSPDLAGRPFLAHRRPEWVALEDKVVVDEFWDRAGVARLPTAVCALEEAPAVAPAIDRGSGTVWAGDAREGFHGGGVHTHWVVDGASADAALDDLTRSCDRVRVMPFVDGIACSIHGIVLPDGVVALRPVELVTLRSGTDLHYAGCATYWDPPDSVRVQMREIARQVGARLREEVSFRGTFTVDGVADADGFWPTELNPRYGAGINAIGKANADLPIMLLNDLIVSGRPIGRSATELEAELVERADATRAGGTWSVQSRPVDPVERSVTRRGDGWVWAGEGDPVDGHVVAGNSFVLCRFNADRIPVGPSVGPLAESFWAFADREIGTGLGPLTAPLDTTR
ncbi:MAG: hypothetical protein ACR2O6_03755 [Ilumatobacteraceae bacterium]